MPVPNTFASATTSIPLSQLDANFATPITLGNTAIQLGNTVTTLNNMTLANVTITSVATTFPNNYLANSSVTIGNTSVSLGSTQTSFGNVTLTNVTISSVASTFPNNFLANSTATLGNATITLGGTTSTVGNLTLNNATINSGTVSITDATVSNSAVISVNTSGDALRITQVGTGNALVVEDSANPDSTPFVVAADGAVGIGTTAPAATLNVVGSSTIQVDTTNNAQLIGTTFRADSTGNRVILRKSRGATINTNTIVQDGDVAGQIIFRAADGTNYIDTALITANVDGTPGTNDMPGRLVFSTTADGASSLTERMRIDNAGRVGIGGSTDSGTTLVLTKSLTGATGVTAVWASASVLSDATVNAFGFRTNIGTQAAAFTLPALIHSFASQATIGAGSTVTNQYGFYANSTLTGATNNFGFYSDIASGTGRWNFYANGTANNYFAGSVGIGSASLTGFNLRVAKSLTGAVTSYSVSSEHTVQSDVTSNAISFLSSPSTQATAFTLTSIQHFRAAQGTIGATSAVTNQYGYVASSSLTGATNNFGFYSDIASGSNRWNFYANGTAENYLGGNLKIGGTAARATTAGTNQLVLFDGTAPVGTLANGVSFYSASGEARVMDAAGNSTLLSPHDSATNEWIFHSKHTPTGKVLRIDVEKMLRFINDHFGLDMIQEFTEE